MQLFLFFLPFLVTLGLTQKNIGRPTYEEKSKGGELEETDGRISKVESVHAEHAQKDGEEERGVEAVAVGPGAVNLAQEGRVAERLADYVGPAGAPLIRLNIAF